MQNLWLKTVNCLFSTLSYPFARLFSHLLQLTSQVGLGNHPTQWHQSTNFHHQQKNFNAFRFHSIWNWMYGATYGVARWKSNFHQQNSARFYTSSHNHPFSGLTGCIRTQLLNSQQNRAATPPTSFENRIKTFATGILWREAALLVRRSLRANQWCQIIL